MLRHFIFCNEDKYIICIDRIKEFTKNLLAHKYIRLTDNTRQQKKMFCLSEFRDVKMSRGIPQTPSHGLVFPNICFNAGGGGG